MNFKLRYWKDEILFKLLSLKINLRFTSWKNEIKNHQGLILISLFLFTIANILNLAAGNYADKAGGVPVPDLILDNIPAINLGFFYLYGYILVIALLILYPILFNVNKFHVILSQLSLLIAIRSFFITLTHLKIPLDAIAVTMPKVFDLIAFQNDLFFSGHTALPFLGFLIFRGQKLGWIFLALTIILALTVLLMHVHYSIDIFAALFIAFGSFKIGEELLKDQS